MKKQYKKENKMEYKKVLKAIEEIEIKLKKQGMIQDERLINHLDNLNQIAFELKKGK